MNNLFDPANYGPQIAALRAELVARLQERVGLDADTAERVAEETFNLAQERGPEMVQALLAASGFGALFGRQ